MDSQRQQDNENAAKEKGGVGDVAEGDTTMGKLTSSYHRIPPIPCVVRLKPVPPRRPQIYCNLESRYHGSGKDRLTSHVA